MRQAQRWSYEAFRETRENGEQLSQFEIGYTAVPVPQPDRWHLRMTSLRGFGTRGEFEVAHRKEPVWKLTVLL